jgi:putative endonuclease
VKRLAEDLAVRFLRRHGCIVLHHNYRAPCGTGEIDLVACQGATLIFVLVNKRTTDEYMAPDCAADAMTQNAAENCARDYVYSHGVEWLHRRFDVMSVVLSHPMRVVWRRDVFREGGDGSDWGAGSGGTRRGQIRATPQSRSSL